MQGSCPSQEGEKGSTQDWVPRAWLSHHPGSPTCDSWGVSCRQWGSSWKASLCSVLPIGAPPGTVGMSPIMGQVQLQEGGCGGGHNLDRGT